MNLLASETSFNSASSAFLRSNQALPSGVARNLRAWILRLLRLVAADLFMIVPPEWLPVVYKGRLRNIQVTSKDTTGSTSKGNM